jgi:prevent-host-death family protein
MKRASISEAKNTLSALLDRVRQGRAVVIEDRGVPVARLEPIVDGVNPEGRLARLRRQSAVRMPVAPLPDVFWKTRPPRLSARRAASEVLIEERREGR